jgi:hypothetical protein
MADENELIKHREIGFRGPHPDADQAGSAMLLLADAQGILDVRRISNVTIGVTYDLRLVYFAALESALQETGFHLDNSLLYKLRRALITYTEEIQRHNLGLEEMSCGQNCAQKVFISSYRKKEHGCRDDRPPHWREYL